MYVKKFLKNSHWNLISRLFFLKGESAIFVEGEDPSREYEKVNYV